MLRTTTNITIDSPLVTLPSGAHSDNLLTKSLKTQKRTTRGPKKPKSIKSFASLEKNFEFMKDRVRDPNNEPRSLWCQVGHRGSQTSQHSTILASRLSPRPLQMESKRNGEMYWCLVRGIQLRRDLGLRGLCAMVGSGWRRGGPESQGGTFAPLAKGEPQKDKDVWMYSFVNTYVYVYIYIIIYIYIYLYIL